MPRRRRLSMSSSTTALLLSAAALAAVGGAEFRGRSAENADLAAPTLRRSLQTTPADSSRISAEKKRLRREKRAKRKAERAAARAAARPAGTPDRGAPRNGAGGGGGGGGGGDFGNGEELQIFVDSLEVDVYPLCGADPSRPQELTAAQKSDLERNLKAFFNMDAECQDDGPGEVVTDSVEILDFEAGEYCFSSRRRAVEAGDADGGTRRLQYGPYDDEDEAERRRRSGVPTTGPKRSALRATRRFRCKRCGPKRAGKKRNKKKKVKSQRALLPGSTPQTRLVEPYDSDFDFEAAADEVPPDDADVDPARKLGQQQGMCPVRLIDVLRSGGFPGVTYAGWAVSIVTVTDCTGGTGTCADPNSGCCGVAPWCACPSTSDEGRSAPQPREQGGKGGGGGNNKQKTNMFARPASTDLCLSTPYSFPKTNPRSEPFSLKTSILLEGFCGDDGPGGSSGGGSLSPQTALDLQSFLLTYFNGLLAEGGCADSGVKFEVIEVRSFKQAGWCSGSDVTDTASSIEVEGWGTCDGDVCIHMYPTEMPHGRASRRLEDELGRMMVG